MQEIFFVIKNLVKKIRDFLMLVKFENLKANSLKILILFVYFFKRALKDADGGRQLLPLTYCLNE